MRLQSVGARLSSTVGVAIVSSVITTTLLTGGYAVATTFLPDNSVSSINIVDGTIRGRDLSARLRARIDAPGPQGPQGPEGPVGPEGPQGPRGAGGNVFGVVVTRLDGDAPSYVNDTSEEDISCAPRHLGTPRCAAVLPAGTEYTLVAGDGQDGEVIWGGDAAACGTDGVCELTIDQDLAVTATFVAPQ